EMPFPADLPPERDEKLRQAIQLHLEALDAYIKRDPASGTARAAAALRLYEEAGALIPQLGQLHHELVVRAYQAGDHRGAVREAERWLKRFPDSVNHLETLGNAEYLAGSFAAAADRLRRAAERRPHSVSLWRRLTQVYAAQGHKEEGLRAAGEALRRIGYPAPGYWEDAEAVPTMRVAVAAFHRFYDYAGLLPIATGLLERFPDDPEALMAVGVARRQLGDHAGAEKLLRRVADDPKNGQEVRYELGIAVLKQGRPREAAAEFADLLERNPYFSRGYFQLGQCLARLGRAGDAEAFFRVSRGLAPSEREFLRETERQGIGRPAEARRARAKALALRGQFREAEAALRDPELAGSPGLAVYRIEFLVEVLRGREAEAELEAAAG
ncbi:MAG: tetratricopeptide repeat protein, partial [Thermoanaerobaculia bacterium]